MFPGLARQPAHAIIIRDTHTLSSESPGVKASQETPSGLALFVPRISLLVLQVLLLCMEFIPTPKFTSLIPPIFFFVHRSHFEHCPPRSPAPGHHSPQRSSGFRPRPSNSSHNTFLSACQNELIVTASEHWKVTRCCSTSVTRLDTLSHSVSHLTRILSHTPACIS